MSNPYKSQSDIAFWSKSVSSNFDASKLVNFNKKLLSPGNKVASAGSCFAANLVPYIESAGLEYIRTEKIPTIFGNLGENLGYANFSAAYGNIYTSRQLLQLYQRALGLFNPSEDRWYENDFVIDPFRPGLKFPAKSDEEFDFLTKSHLDATRQAFESADVFIFTLGLTESWVNSKDLSVYPACPGTVAGSFDPENHSFKNFKVDEIISDLREFIILLRKTNKQVKLILSVSPVPLVATATTNHVLNSTIYSKSVLRVAAQEITNEVENSYYFPAYEIITGPQAPHDFFENDRRNVSQKGVEAVMKALLISSGLTTNENSKLTKLNQVEEPSEISNLSAEIAVADCDELYMDSGNQET